MEKKRIIAVGILLAALVAVWLGIRQFAGSDLLLTQNSSTIPTAVRTASGVRVSSQPFSLERAPLCFLSVAQRNRKYFI